MVYTKYMDTEKNRPDEITSMRVRRGTLEELRKQAAHKLESDDAILQRVLEMHKKKEEAEFTKRDKRTASKL